MFLYTFMSGVSISFPHLFLCSLNEVHRSSTVGHALIHPIFIHIILLFLGLADFPSNEPVHVVAPLGATFLRQRVAETSSAAADVLPPTTLNDSDIRRTLDHILIIQAAQG